MNEAVLLVGHGTVDDLEELPQFLANIRHGRPAPPDVVAEVTRRYRAIGGRSPLNAISREVAEKLETKLGLPVRTSNRLWRPYPAEVLRALRAEGVERVAVVPLAQHSAHVYAEAVEKAAAEVSIAVACAKNWGQAPLLLEAFARRIRAARKAGAIVVMTAHSLPTAVIESGDAYEAEVRASAASIARALGLEATEHRVAFQSQGMGAGPGGKPMSWLGPDLRTTLAECKSAGARAVLVAPIGFLADHVEILFDIDIEAKAWAHELGLDLARSESLNASDDFVRALASVAAPLLRAGA